MGDQQPLNVKEIRTALREAIQNTTLYQEVFIAHSAVMLLIEPQSGAIVAANPAAARFYGYPLETLQQMNIGQINTLPPGALAEALQAALMRERDQFIFQHRLASGEIRDVEVHSVPIHLDGFTLLYSIIHDITERQRAEATLRASEARYRTLFNDAPVVLWEEEAAAIQTYLESLRQTGVRDFAAYFAAHPQAVMDCLGALKVLNVNAAALAFYKARDQAELTANLPKTFTAQTLQTFTQALIALAEKKTSFEAETTQLTLHGDLRYVIMRVFLSMQGAQDTTRVVLAVTDITAQKQAEAALQASLARYDTLVAHIPVGVYIFWTHADGAIRFEYVSDRWCEIHQLTREAVLADVNAANALVHPDELEMFLERNREAARRREPFFWEGRFIIGGTVRWLRVHSTPEVQPNGDIRWFGVTEDITAYKHMEIALRDREAELSAIVESAPFAMLVIDKEWRVQKAIDHRRDFLTAPEAVLPGTPCGETLDCLHTHEDPRGCGFGPACANCRLRQTVLDTIATGQSYYDVEITMTCMRHGVEQERVVLLYATPLEVGGVRRALVILRDVTASRQAEAKLHESETLLNAAGRLAKVGGWALDAQTREVYWTEETYRIHEVPPDYRPSLEEALAFYPPEDRYRVATAIQRAFDTGMPFDMETRFITATGKPLWTRIICHPQIGNGKTVRLVGVFQDITERKQTEVTLQKSLERLQLLHTIDAAILATHTPEELARAVLTHLRTLIPYQLACISEVDAAQRRGREIAIMENDHFIASPTDWYPLSNIGILKEVLQQEHVYYVQDLATQENLSLLEQNLLARGLHTYITTPLKAQNTLIGALNLAAETPAFFQPAHLEVVREIANSLAVALHQARMMEQIRTDAETKAMLLREVNHRVLNNLTMVQALIGLEQRRAGPQHADVQASLQDLYNHIEGLVVVHRLLSNAQWQSLDLTKMISKTIDAALGYASFQRNIKFSVHGPDAPLLVTPKQAVALALIFNELTTNSIKYAFAGRAQGKIDITLTPVPGQDARLQVRVAFRDDGPGWPTAILEGQQHNIGLWLVESNIKRTLNGELTLYNDHGAVVEFTFTLTD